MLPPQTECFDQLSSKIPKSPMDCFSMMPGSAHRVMTGPTPGDYSIRMRTPKSGSMGMDRVSSLLVDDRPYPPAQNFSRSLTGKTRKRRSQSTVAPRSSIRTKAASSHPRNLQTHSAQRALQSVWTARAAGWTTSVSNGYGKASSTKTFT
jgi:hypothetical protein